MNKEAAATALAVGAGLAFLFRTTQVKRNTTALPKILQDDTVGPLVKTVIRKYVDKMTTPESLIKIFRQLDFWYSQGLSEEELVEITENLCEKATILSSGFQCPKVRFGKTELQMPIVTCGGMRLQQTWCPDFVPIAPSPKKVLKSPSHANLTDAIRLSLKMGINHFETARMYGSSEYQFADALYQMMQSGEIKREDFIFQTKIPPKETRKEWEKLFEQSWAHCEKLGYIDLLSFWCVSSEEQAKWMLDDGKDMCMAAALEYKAQGKIKHIGFSTHGTAPRILEIIESGKMEYVNLHDHFIGSYHASGTRDGQGGQGLHYAVKRALQLDMGVFNISPIDKGGAMYKPSKTLARTLGPKMTPIEFSMLSGWNRGHHTASVGFARPADIEDAISAARMWTQKDAADQVKAAEQRMNAQFEKELGKEWYEKGLLNLPTCEDEATHGTAIGHVLWLYNLMKAFGMYDFCKARYKSLSECPWKKGKPFEDNLKRMNPGNMGRAFIPGLNYSEALKDHYNPLSAKVNMEKLHEWMQIKASDNQTLKENGFDDAYDLRVWNSFPGDSPNVTGVVIQNLTFGMFGCHGGPTKSSAELASMLVEEVNN